MVSIVVSSKHVSVVAIGILREGLISSLRVEISEMTDKGITIRQIGGKAGDVNVLRVKTQAAMHINQLPEQVYGAN